MGKHLANHTAFYVGYIPLCCMYFAKMHYVASSLARQIALKRSTLPLIKPKSDPSRGLIESQFG